MEQLLTDYKRSPRKNKHKMIEHQLEDRSTEAECSEEELEFCVRKAKQIRDGMPGLKSFEKYSTIMAYIITTWVVS